MRRAAVGAGLGVLGLGMSGCAAVRGSPEDLNARPTLGATVRLPAMDAGDAANAPVGETQAAMDATPLGQPTMAAALTRRLDRADWAPERFVVPVDGTVHGRTWRGRFGLAQSTARQEGLFPTASTGLELQGASGAAQVWEGVLAPPAAIVDVFALPVRVVLEPPGTVAQSPWSVTKRWKPGAWSAGPTAAPGVAAPVDAAPVDAGQADGATGDAQPAATGTPGAAP